MKITIVKEVGGSFFVGIGDKYDSGLTYDEALACASIAMLNGPDKVKYLKTKEQHESWCLRFSNGHVTRDIREV